MKFSKSILEVKPDSAMAQQIEQDLEQEDVSLASVLEENNEIEVETEST